MAVTRDELLRALDVPSDYLPYIDTSIDVVDGSIEALVDWLLERYVITPRDA